MSTSEYSPVTWSDGDPMDTTKLQQMVDNTRLIFENSPNYLANSHGIVKDNGLRIFAATTEMPTSTGDVVYKTMYFGNFFSPGCQPIIATGVNTQVHKRFYTTYNGIGTTFHPDHRGIEICLISLHDVGIKYTVSVNVIAIGW